MALNLPPVGRLASWVTRTAGPAFRSVAAMRRHDSAARGFCQDQDVPRLAGQRPNYLLIQLEQYVNKEPKTPQPSDMAEKLAEVARVDLPARSAFYSSVD